MGYRHYLAIIDKDIFKKIDEKFIDEYIKESSKYPDEQFFRIYDFVDKYGKEIAELGKYSDEGFHLCRKRKPIANEYPKQYDLLKKLCDNNEYGFNLLTEKDLIFLIKCYKKRTVNYWEKMLGLIEDKWDNNTPEVKCKQYVKEKLGWKDFLINLKSPYKVQSCWFYEYELFDLIHCYKTIDWNKYLLIIYGW